MKINTYEGKTEEEAIARAKEELGGEPVILNVKEVNAPGFFGIFKKHTYRVTAAIEDDSMERTVLPPRQPAPALRQKEENHRFSAIANEDTLKTARSAVQPSEPRADEAILPGAKNEDLKSVFREVGEVISQAKTPPISQVGTYDKNATIIKYRDPAHSAEYSQSGRQALTKDEQLRPTAPRRGIMDTIPLPRLDMEPQDARPEPPKPVSSHYGVIKMLYNTLLGNEVDERYVNDILNDIDSIMLPGTNTEMLISSVYQKMVLKLGRPNPIVLGANRPKVVFFVGPTGVGKTTTLAKIAAHFKVTENRNVAFLTADTYRIKAEDQLREYANILNITTETYFEGNDINELIKKYRKNDLILVDTFGFSYRNEEQKTVIRTLLEQVDSKYDTSIYLVLSATTKYVDLKAIVDSYKDFTDFDLIFTKLDETNAYGNIYNIRQYANKALSYVTNGQVVPGDFAVIDTQNLVKQLLGGQ
ncbi:MAG: flagellar biosynthesis protein FlhF [Lachnospiraceae bacterium]|nr:flagellar biosynthesis protein FlhF [Lachnospiraceae bacterium]